MNEEDEDEIDKMLYHYFEQHKPKMTDSTRRAIQTAFDKENEKKHKKTSSFFIVSRVATVLITFSIFFSSFAFAGDFWKTIRLIFTNSNEIIDEAVQKGNVQKIDMDFVENNGVRVKADYIFMDDKNLNISFVYQYEKDHSDEVEEIGLNDITITNEKGEIIALVINEGYREEIMPTTIRRERDQEKIDNKTLKESIFITLSNTDFPPSKQLFIVAETTRVKTKSDVTEVTGKWEIIINLEEKSVKV